MFSGYLLFLIAAALIYSARNDSTFCGGGGRPRSVRTTSVCHGVSIVLFVFTVLFRTAPILLADPANTYKMADPGPGWFFTSICKDRAGRLWLGTEDRGVVWYDPSARCWNQACAPSTLDDISVYSLACDSHGFIWVGTLNHGAAVFNGLSWKYYGQYDGLRGQHVIGIAVNPLDSSVWVATEAGVNRRSDATGAWTFFPTSVGGSLTPPTCLAFAADGTLYVGTQCDGILIASPSDNYRSWRSDSGSSQLPNRPQGNGLGCAMINCILVDENGFIWVGTVGGISYSQDHGQTWKYNCGQDWAAKQAGLLNAGDQSRQLADEAIAKEKFVMSEDYVTCLAQEPDGNIWIGHRSQPCESLNPDSLTLEQVGKADDQKAVYAMGMAPGNGVMTIATYGNGLVSIVDSPKVATIPSDDSTHTDGPVTIGDAAASVDQLPVDANVPESELIEAQLKTLLAVPPSPGEYQPFVAPLPDDWVTGGDWLGRYGTYWAVLCATSSPHDFVWGAAPTKVRYSAKIGPNHVGKDSLRYWVEWLYTARPSVLELPTTYLRSRILRAYTTANVSRRESEWDDHGEAYDRTLDGPNVYVTVAVPAGLFRLSTYHLDKDAHDSLFNVTRDYRISIREHPKQEPLHDISAFESMPELAHARIVNFWGGVWKRFIVRGPVDLTIEFNRNYSTNTTVSAVTLDLLDGDPPPYYQTFAQYEARLASRYGQWSADSRKSASNSNLSSVGGVQVQSKAADGLLAELDRLKYENSTWWALNEDTFYPNLVHWYCAPSFSSSPKPEMRLRAKAVLAKCYFETGLYSKSESCLTAIGQLTARSVERSLPWDGITGSGEGYKVVTSYMASTYNLPKTSKTKSLH